VKYRLLLLPRAQKDLDAFRGRLFERLREAIGILAEEPRPPGSRKLTDADGYRVRVGDYRILYRVDDKEKKVFIYRVRHRREVYR
jgi:mRNA interferase RelE/StbE